MNSISKKLLILLVIVAVASSLFNREIPGAQAYELTTTRVFDSLSADGYLWRDHPTSWGIVHNATSSEFLYDTTTILWLGSDNGGGDYDLWRFGLFFDTSILPADANILSANLSLFLVTDETSGGDFLVTIQDGTPNYPSQPMAKSDYWQGYYSGNGGNATTNGMSTLSYNNITLTDAGESWISLTSTTKFMIRSSLDISNSTPTGYHRTSWRSKEHGASTKPLLYVRYQTSGAYLYRLYGAYDEEGDRDGSINCTFYRPAQERLNFTLDGEQEVTSEADTRMVFHFDLGNNFSRVFYVGDQTYMEIYVMKPSEPYYVYYFTIIDFVGLTNGYLETLLNINGTDQIVERWRLDILNDIPYTLSWGVAYKVRVVADQGTYNFGTFVAGATSSFTLVVTQSMFPEADTHIYNISISVGRPYANLIQMNYSDALNETNWIYIEVRRHSDGAVAYSSNTSAYSVQDFWSQAENNTDYRVHITVDHASRGSLSWIYSLPAPTSYTNPWSLLNVFGNFPFDLSQMIGVSIVALVFASFSSQNAPVGMIVGVITAILLTAIGFLDISWAWLTVTFAVAMIASISMVRKRSEKIG